MTRSRLAAVLAIALAVLILVPAVAQALGAPKQRPLRPCPTEDASGMRACVWDAKHMGNGTGKSFIYIKASGGRIIFVTHAQAHSLLSW